MLIPPAPTASSPQSPSASASPQEKAIDDMLEKARQKWAMPGFVYAYHTPTVQQCAERTTNELAAAAEKDDTPELLYLDGYDNVRWEDFLDGLLAKNYVAMGAVALLELQKPPPVKPPPTPLSIALDSFEETRRRLTGAINGNDMNSDEAKDLRARIYGGRTPVRTRSGYETEYELVIAALRELIKNDRTPKGVARMLPRLEEGLATLKGLPPTMPGRQAKPEDLPPVEVQVTTLALHLALGELLSHASSTAADARLRSMSKIILPKRPADSGDGAKKDKDKPSEENSDVEAKKTAPGDANADAESAPTPDAETSDEAVQPVAATPGPVASGSADTLGPDAPVNGVSDRATPAPESAPAPVPVERSGRRKKHRMRPR